MAKLGRNAPRDRGLTSSRRTTGPIAPGHASEERPPTPPKTRLLALWVPAPVRICALGRDDAGNGLHRGACHRAALCAGPLARNDALCGKHCGERGTAAHLPIWPAIPRMPAQMMGNTNNDYTSTVLWMSRRSHSVRYDRGSRAVNGMRCLHAGSPEIDHAGRRHCTAQGRQRTIYGWKIH